ncbi:unnamed protein product [Rotaria magnacalcarata]|uniref:RRM domain-containing protein n=2 Tax=Rotaria magnacalcarata TaxID=392030 RepID=A0A816PUA2_9BILA|nr:unnamed protein product [Rotaria magnacalcarata]CAF1628360.1 unnamed protein product [Rotaria magnacalcarata]CAF2053322.1 unnamed protein product [Rotaria magnacalcarata]
MKVAEKDTKPTEKSPKPVTKNGGIEKKKKKEDFEVRIPRIIVRNLNFKVNEDQLKKAFEKINATINNTSIVKRDGQSKGFGFVTFEKLDDAQKAIQELNGKKLLGRPMAIDWSLPKNVYEKMHTKETPLIKRDSYGIHSISKQTEVKQEPEEGHGDEQEDMIEDEEEDMDEDDDDDDQEEEEEEEEESKTRTKESSRDVREHRTLFVRNVPFDATEDDLKNILSSNGQRRIVSCRLVIDPVSRHPRGSAFVQFATCEDAQACLNLPFTLRGQDLQADLALGRDELVKAKELRDQKQENNKKHDQRNLTLANYGVILNIDELDGNETDLRKRQKLEDIKKEKLKNPLHFISPTRLTIHNLPKHVDDNILRKLIIDTLTTDKIPKKDIILKECRVMKTSKDAKKSLGFGFVSLARHEIALRIIELLNNNKLVFGPNRRPIVQFSIENRRALQLKEERIERIKAKQELLKNPSDKKIAFETNKKKKQRTQVLDQQTNKIRLSDIIKQAVISEELNNTLNDDDHSMEVDNNTKFTNRSTYDAKRKNKKKRSKTKSKGEIRDNVDRMIASSRNKKSLPQKTKEKWFE